ncbi:hypothetical protein K432DRAFT_353352 [Lepidopterella palustris CBS 459.81]|uniref:Tail specific protease domain-containing protein n=1 Tax=Lepidopterella palustris CBS 459.81 TaxID=1314670 RepID=A0A8E2EAI8_9PEZI|nr:hypothetical protein K432DRAFT_353352 [Lepidopterella palustris CBS 459.81]
MRSIGLFIVGAASALTVSVPSSSTITVPASLKTSAVTFSSLKTGTASLEPCAVVSASLAALSPSASAIVPAQVAYDCLNSVPIDVDGDLTQIAELKVFLEWQTNLQYFKNPPPGYTEKPVDILGGLDQISAKVKSGGYKSDYAVQTDIVALLNQGYDNHLFYAPDMLGVFGFQRSFTLVSISTDGIALPEAYVFSDLLKLQQGAKFTPSPVNTINSQNATAYLSNVALQNTYHDADVRFNALFLNQALISTGSNSVGTFFAGIYDGPSTNITFKNGTAWNSPNIANVRANFTGVNNGSAFFQKFCEGPVSTTSTATAAATSTPAAASSTVKAPAPSATNYPEPVVIHSGLAIGGYYLNGTGYEDVAVLTIPVFEPKGTSDDPIVEFQDVLREFLADATSDKKQYLVIDMRGNGGGNTILGFEVFKQLFPTIVPFGASRYRAHDAFEIIGSIAAELVSNATFIEENPDVYQKIMSGYGSFNYKASLDVNNQPWKSFDAFYGPQVVYGDNFTNIWRYNFSDPYSTSYPSFSLTGYINNTKVGPQPFKAENIVILQDGYCSSTCAIFSELMREQGHVQSVAIGGLPTNAPMQAVGGTKGSLTFSYPVLQQFASGLIEFAASRDNKTAAQLNSTVLGTLAYPKQLFKRAMQDENGALGQINAADNLRKGDTSQTPLEFVYEAADCKLFYTADMYLDVTKVWKAVANAKWGNGTCVPGSTGAPSSISGGVYNNTNTGNSTNSTAPYTPMCGKLGYGYPCPSPNAASAWGVPSLTMLIAGAVVAIFL